MHQRGHKNVKSDHTPRQSDIYSMLCFVLTISAFLLLRRLARHTVYSMVQAQAEPNTSENHHESQADSLGLFILPFKLRPLSLSLMLLFATNIVSK